MCILPERGPYLTAIVGVSLELASETEVAEVVDPDTAVVGSDQNLEN